MLVEERAQRDHIGLVGYKGCRDEVHVIFDAEEQILLVLLGEILALEHVIGEIHALAVRYHAAGDDIADGIVSCQLPYLKDEQSVVDKDG